MKLEAGKYYETRAGCKAAQVDVQREEYGPIRTVTRRGIVPGVYAKLTIDTAGPDHVRVATSVNMSAEELREAAHLFSQLAEVLEESNANPR